MRIAILRTLALGGVCAMTALGLNSTAQAGETDAQACGHGYVTLYEHDNYNGHHRGWCGDDGTGDGNLANNFWTGTQVLMNDQASSVINNINNHSVDLCSSANRAGDCTNIGTLSRDGDLSNNNVKDNRTSSVSILG